MRICTIDGCEETHVAKGYCKKHYRVFKQYGDPLAVPKKQEKSSYENNRKEIDNISHKLCSICEKWLPLERDYYKNKTSKDGFNPYCKECTKNRTRKWREANPEMAYLIEKRRRERIPERFKEVRRNFYEKNKEHERKYYNNWIANNKNKLATYRNAHNKHDITEQEWFECIDYFGRTCAYCGMTEEQQFNKYNENFHREHVIHDGSNYIENCVPSCTGCNTSKSDSEFSDWYNDSNVIFNESRLSRIVKWMTEDCMYTLNIK